jgi:hypothetical protein
MSCRHHEAVGVQKMGILATTKNTQKHNGYGRRAGERGHNMVAEMINFELWRQNDSRVGTRGNLLQIHAVAGQMCVAKQKETYSYHFVSLPQ